MHEVRRAIPIDTINVDNRNYESILACRIKKKKEKKRSNRATDCRAIWAG
jgi:hypothetical protein